jgi:hypothetical protein
MDKQPSIDDTALWTPEGREAIHRLYLAVTAERATGLSQEAARAVALEEVESWVATLSDPERGRAAAAVLALRELAPVADASPIGAEPEQAATRFAAPSVAVRSYRARTPEAAAALFAADATSMARAGYVPTSQSWADGKPGVGRVLTLGLMAAVAKPDGTLTVTYARRPG